VSRLTYTLAQLGYLKSGHVQLLLAQDCYGWGAKSVELLLCSRAPPPSAKSSTFQTGIAQ